MKKVKKIYQSLEKEKSILLKELEKKFNECFLGFNDNLEVPVTFRGWFTKYNWYQQRNLFTEEHLVKNDFYNKFTLQLYDYSNDNEELIECIEMFGDYIEYDYEVKEEILQKPYQSFGIIIPKHTNYLFQFKKRKVK